VHPAVAARNALRRYQRWAYVMAAVAVAAGAFLLPAGDELLLIHLRNRDIGRARQVLDQGASFGVSSAASVAAHNELDLFEGQVDEALQELEHYVAANPDDVHAWRRLAQLDENAQRLYDQTASLEQVYRLAPDATLARQLITLHRRAGNERAEAQRLSELVVRGDADVDEYLRSARLAAALGSREPALDHLERLRRRDPRAFGYAEIELYASLLLDLGYADQLAQRVQTMPLLREQPDAMMQLAAAMRGWGRVDAALALLNPLPGMEPSPRLLEARARIAVGTSEARRVVNELVVADRSRPLDREGLDALVSLAASVPDFDVLDNVLSLPGRTPSPIVLAAAIGTAVSSGARTQAQSLIARFGDDMLAESPLLALDLAVDRGDDIRADHWIAAISDSGSATPEQIAALAQYESKLGLDARAFDRLTALAASGRAPQWALNDLAAIAARLHREETTMGTLAAASSRSREAHDTWMRLAASSGHHQAIEEWLGASTPQRQDAALLRDLYYLLSEQHDLPLATAAARRLYAVTGDSGDGLMLGQALLAAGRPGEALAPLRRSHARSDEAERAFDSALSAALLDGEEVSSELRSRFVARLHDEIPDVHRSLLIEGLWAAGDRATVAPDVIRLARRDLDRWLPVLVESTRADGSPRVRREAVALIESAIGSSPRAGAGRAPDAREENLVRALVDIGASDDVLLPHVKRMAYGAGETWTYAFDQLLERGGNVPARVELWARVGTSRDMPVDQRRAAAAKLVELGARNRASAVMQDLAADRGPDDHDVQQLLFLWGHAPASTEIDWLVERLESAPNADRSGWMRHLVSVGAADRVARLYPQLPEQADADLIDSWVDAHRAAGDRDSFANALDSVLVRSTLPATTLKHVAGVALADGHPARAYQAYLRLAAAEPTSRDAQRWLGSLAFYDGRSTEARQWLQAYVDHGGTEAEPLFQMGELSLALQREDEARVYFTRAHETLTTGKTTNHALLANVLVRLDERTKARDEFEQMLDRDPDLDHVRADYAATLMQWRDWERAGEVLQIKTPPVPRQTPPDPAAARRVDLLRVQWLTYHGHYTRTSDLLTDLGQRFPRDPDVLLARGRFDADRGRQSSADRNYLAARLEAPHRDDIAKLLDENERVRSPYASVQLDARTVGHAWEERSERAMVVAHVQPHLPVSFSLDRLHVSAPAVRGDEGRTAPLETSPTRFEATAALPLWPGMSVAPTLMGTNGGAGVGITATHHDLHGSSTLIAERGRPYWELLEAVAADGRRDRLGLQRQWRFRADTAAWALVDFNDYRLATGHRAATAALGVGVIRTIRQGQPSLTLQYGLDKEHRRSGTVVTTPEGLSFAPVPLASREVHLFGAIAKFNPFRVWEGEATGGYTLDRLGGRGAFMTARLTPPPNATFGVALWAERRLYTIATTERVLRAGMSLTVRF
jgi:tetratricopeptide (TPR) repeat protein